LGKLILLVEDQFLIRLLMAESLADDGFCVVEADDGDQAISLIATLANCDLLITDIQMPGRSDGNAVARAAKAKFSGLPTVYMTGNPASISHRVEPQDVVMKKPFSPEELMLVVTRMVT
jgi:CheY-like chemotaxis protein